MRKGWEEFAPHNQAPRHPARNHRRHARISRRDEMLASIGFEGADTVEEAIVTHCEARDASPGGVGLVARRQIPEGRSH